MKKEDAEEFTQSLGQIVGGSWRQIALAKRLGVPQALDLSVDEWVNKRLGGYIRMNVEDRRQAVQELKADGASTREIADVVGMDHATIARDLAVANATKDTVKDADSVANATPAPLDAVAALAVVRRDDDEIHNHRAQGTGENEWYTPSEHIERVRRFLGGITLDPASSVAAQAVIRADKYFTLETDGLSQEWGGKVWLNPPYAQPAIFQFCEKTIAEMDSGRVSEAVVLTHNYTDTEWFHLLARAARAICFTRGRIAFINQSGERAAPTQGQAFFYFAQNDDRLVAFGKAFAELGFCVRPR